MTVPGTSDEFRASVGGLWDALVEHDFPRTLADGTLPPERFRFYISQNIMYLPEYARMIAVGASRTPDLRGLEESTRAMANIVDVEIPQNLRMREAIVEIAGPVTDADLVLAPATAAYTSWLLAIAATGSALDIQAALLPCAWSYGVIARRLVGGASEHPVYSEWVRFFASDDYDAVVVALREAFDRDLAEAPAPVRERLAAIFLMGCRMERQFWDQGLTGSHWPDLTETDFAE
jgi:thiaminase/transcriptional activator TenA